MQVVFIKVMGVESVPKDLKIYSRSLFKHVCLWSSPDQTPMKHMCPMKKVADTHVLPSWFWHTIIWYSSQMLHVHFVVARMCLRKFMNHPTPPFWRRKNKKNQAFQHSQNTNHLISLNLCRVLYPIDLSSINLGKHSLVDSG